MNESPLTPADLREPTPVPPAPRPLTAEASRLIWLEPRVRRWWLLIILLLLVFAAFVAYRLWDRHAENDLIQNGVAVQAKIVAAVNKIREHPVGPGDVARLEVEWPDNPEELPDAILSTNGYVGHEITLHVDKNDHSRWTDRSAPTPLLDSLFVGLLALPVLPVLIVLMVLQWQSVRRLWQNGTAAPAVVFDRQHSPLAPMSYAVRCSRQDSSDRQLFTVYLPRQNGAVKKGDLIWVITPARKGRPLAVGWFQRQGS